MDVTGQRRLHVPLARRYYEHGRLNEIMDLDLNIRVESVKEFSKIAYRCLNEDLKERPPMGVVLQKLEKAIELLELEEASELQESVEALVLQKIVEALELQELVKALELDVCLNF